MSIALALYATAKHIPQVLGILVCMLHTIRPGVNGTSYEIISQTRTLHQYSNAPPRSENDSRAVSQSPVDSELGDPFIAHLEFSGLNADLELDDLSIACIGISGLNVDLALDGLSVVRLEFSRLKTMSSSYGTVVF